MEPVLQAESDGIKAEADLKRAKYAHSTTLAQGKNLKTAKDARAELTAALFELAKLQMVREQNAQGSNERVEEMRLKRAVHEQRTMELRYRMSLTGGPPPPHLSASGPSFNASSSSSSIAAPGPTSNALGTSDFTVGLSQMLSEEVKTSCLP
ncbi:hypothetical protein SERLADRAFT_457305 [Serpula lacrymans var. lacrymans S7.9]|uniref:Uncharacterized protein n=1 Tax=Serpula lacrymans var. lacrymans (strain S7.9) TaxID=578457 RepID=F8NIE6_SERL9|nr:uncharacterized protein SERLADRAFT_457305 [Serpula lacrymans var. lacrymans S7.9]EGO29495.1 hypothetical protein SERLADRAFT_457305 [Serpula lacrymans var. lacrymans S7.9]